MNKNASQEYSRGTMMSYPPDGITARQLSCIWETYIESEGKDPGLDRDDQNEQNELLLWLARQRSDLIRALQIEK